MTFVNNFQKTILNINSNIQEIGELHKTLSKLFFLNEQYLIENNVHLPKCISIQEVIKIPNLTINPYNEWLKNLENNINTWPLEKLIIGPDYNFYTELLKIKRIALNRDNYLDLEIVDFTQFWFYNNELPFKITILFISSL